MPTHHIQALILCSLSFAFCEMWRRESDKRGSNWTWSLENPILVLIWFFFYYGLGFCGIVAIVCINLARALGVNI